MAYIQYNFLAFALYSWELFVFTNLIFLEYFYQLGALLSSSNLIINVRKINNNKKSKCPYWLHLTSWTFTSKATFFDITLG